MHLPEMTIRLPEWVTAFIDHRPMNFSGIEDRMNFVIDLSRKNIEHRTGGPFGAAVFDPEGSLIAAGVNMVIPENCSILHAEMVAIGLAQKILGRFDISDFGQFAFDLFTSAEPCAMCFGAIPWSGIRRVVCGAGRKDAEAVGFDEGPKPENWIAELNSRGIDVVTNIGREKAAAVLSDYAKMGGLIYSPGNKGGLDI